MTEIVSTVQLLSGPQQEDIVPVLSHSDQQRDMLAKEK